ncbi:MAG: YmL10 [Candelina submexicana]|nr:MAG: YmL10 [Candelina submexicana]
MPPQLKHICAPYLAGFSSSPLSSFLLPFLQQQQRAASILSSLSDNQGAYNKRIRRGRGPASGKGKTSGRGHKGQKQHGKVPRGFQGGQTPLEVVHGKRGFENQFSVEMSPVNLDRIQSWIDQGRLDPNKTITMKELNDSRCLHGVKDGVKLLARGAEQLKSPMNIIVSRASTAAIKAIEDAGGKVTTRYYTPFSIRRVLRGESNPAIDSPSNFNTVTDHTSPFQYRMPDPTSRKDIEYYRDPAHRGYLSHLVPEGEGPSLFFKTPGNGRVLRGKRSARSGGKSTKGDNRIW